MNVREAAFLSLGKCTPGGKYSNLEVDSAIKKYGFTGLYIRRIDDRTYYNLRTDDEIEIVKSTDEDSLKGSIDFKGKIKGEITERTNKHGNKFQTFSGVSQDKDGEKRGWLWVRFLVPKPIQQDFFKPDAYVEVKGELLLHIYQGNVNIECHTSSVEPWELTSTHTE